MQIVQILNDFIKVLYTPEFETICIADFMLVRDDKNCYLGQVISIEDDKFDNEKNLAQIKITHEIDIEGKISPYTRQLPNKHAEVLFANYGEILNFVNQGKKTLRVGEDVKYSRDFELNLNFFENNAVMFCDKVVQYNHLAQNLARNLNQYKKIIVFDYTGSIKIPEAKEIKAKIDFKLPLDNTSIDSIWKKGLSSASLETQSILEEIFNEIKSYLKLTKDGFIPFQQFIKVILKQYKATPIRELMVLKNRLIKYQQDELFANRKSDFKSIVQDFEASRTIIVNMAYIKNDWQKDFVEFVLKNVKMDSIVFLRLNENNFDSDLYDYMSSPLRPYRVIPSIAHSFTKLPVVCENRFNYIVAPTLAIKKDFGCFENIVSTLSKNNFMLLGDDTQNFAFIVKNLKIKNKIQEADMRRFEAKVTIEGDVLKNKRVKEKIENLKEQKTKEISGIVDDFLYNSPQKNERIQKEVNTSQINLANNMETHKNITIQEDIKEPKKEIQEIANVEIPQNNIVSSTEQVDNNENSKSFNVEEFISEDELDLFEQEENTNINPIDEDMRHPNNNSETAEMGDDKQYPNNNSETVKIDNNTEIETFSPEFLDALDEINLGQIEEYKEEYKKDNIEPKKDVEVVPEITQDNNNEVTNNIKDTVSEDIVVNKVDEMEELVNESVELTFDQMLDDDTDDTNNTDNKDNESNTNSEETIPSAIPLELFDKEEDEFNVMNEVEDSFANNQNTTIETSTDVNNKIQTVEFKEKEEVQVDKSSDDTASGELKDIKELNVDILDLDNIQNNTNNTDIDNTRLNEDEIYKSETAQDEEQNQEQNIINTENTDIQTQTDEVEQFDLEKPLEDEASEYAKEFIEDIPVLIPDKKEKNNEVFKEGDNVTHAKYGKGVVLQVIEYSDKILLQIDFNKIGKRLLDPDMAGVKKA